MSVEVYLRRDEITADGVRGVLRVGTLTLHTLEDDWKNNRRGESCIPASRYPLKLVRRPPEKGGYLCYEVQGVPGRSLIRIHPGNTEEDIEGCILVGLSRGWKQVAQDEDTKALSVTKRAVISSKEAFRQFMAAMDGEKDGWITVSWAETIDPALHPGG